MLNVRLYKTAKILSKGEKSKLEAHVFNSPLQSLSSFFCFSFLSYISHIPHFTPPFFATLNHPLKSHCIRLAFCTFFPPKELLSMWCLTCAPTDIQILRFKRNTHYLCFVLVVNWQLSNQADQGYA